MQMFYKSHVISVLGLDITRHHQNAYPLESYGYGHLHIMAVGDNDNPSSIEQGKSSLVVIFLRSVFCASLRGEWGREGLQINIKLKIYTLTPLLPPPPHLSNKKNIVCGCCTDWRGGDEE